MKQSRIFALATILTMSGTCALAANVRTDYDHNADFGQYKTYSWGTITTSNPFDESRVKSEISKDLQAKGWQLVPSGGSATIFVKDKVKNEQELETTYNGLGGWGGGWGWGGWGGGFGRGGFGEESTTTENQPVGHLVLDIFSSSDHKLLFRGLSDDNLSNKSGKNIKNLDKDIDDILKKVPIATKG